MSNSNSTDTRTSALITLIKGIVAIGVIIALFWGAKYIFVNPLRDIGNKIVECLKGSESIESKVLIIQKTEQVADLVTLEQPFEHEYTYINKKWWPWSKKEITIRAGFRVLGGIDVDKPEIFRLIFPAKDNAPIFIENLQGKLIACEMIPDSFRIIKDEDGLWNVITSEERAIAISQLHVMARKHIVEKTDFIKQAERSFIQLIKEKTGLQSDIQIKNVQMKDSRAL